MPPKPPSLTSPENRVAFAREYTRLWQEYFKFFADGFDERKIFDQDEQQFLRIMHLLAAGQYRFVELGYPHFTKGEDVLKVLTETVSLNTIKQMSEAQFSKLLIDWHTVFIAMNKAIGKLNLQVPVPKK